jgi:hypothetical protein
MYVVDLFGTSQISEPVRGSSPGIVAGGIGKGECCFSASVILGDSYGGPKALGLDVYHHGVLTS